MYLHNACRRPPQAPSGVRRSPIDVIPRPMRRREEDFRMGPVPTRLNHCDETPYFDYRRSRQRDMRGYVRHQSPTAQHLSRGNSSMMDSHSRMSHQMCDRSRSHPQEYFDNFDEGRWAHRPSEVTPHSAQGLSRRNDARIDNCQTCRRSQICHDALYDDMSSSRSDTSSLPLYIREEARATPDTPSVASSEDSLRWRIRFPLHRDTSQVRRYRNENRHRQGTQGETSTRNISNAQSHGLRNVRLSGPRPNDETVDSSMSGRYGITPSQFSALRNDLNATFQNRQTPHNDQGASNNRPESSVDSRAESRRETRPEDSTMNFLPIQARLEWEEKTVTPTQIYTIRNALRVIDGILTEGDEEEETEIHSRADMRTVDVSDDDDDMGTTSRHSEHDSIGTASVNQPIASRLRGRRGAARK